MRGALTMAGVLMCAACGGQPVLSHVPRPNPAVVAGAAIAVAGAATIANPNAAGRKPEDPSAGAGRRTVATEEMPGDVLDRLSDAEDRGDVPAERPRVFEADAGAFPIP